MCKICDGSGMIEQDGVAEPCYACLVDRYHKSSGVPDGYRDVTLAVLDEEWGSGTLDLKRCAGQVMTRHNRQHWLAIMGSPGNGKTTALYAVVNHFNSKGNAAARAKYWTMPALKMHLQGGIGQPGGVEQRLNELLEIPVLAIDELDKIAMTDWMLETVAHLVDQRWIAAKARRQITLWAMNEEPRSAWIKSRLLDSTWDYVMITSPDVRLAMPAYKADEFDMDVFGD